MKGTDFRVAYNIACQQKKILLISGRVDEASANETLDSGLIPGRVKSKTTKLGIHSFPERGLAIKMDSVKSLLCVVDTWAGGNVT